MYDNGPIGELQLLNSARVEAFGRSLVTLVDRATPAKSLVLEKPTNRVSHVSGQRIKPGSAEESTLRAWVDRLAKLSGDERAAAVDYRSGVIPVS